MNTITVSETDRINELRYAIIEAVKNHLKPIILDTNNNIRPIIDNFKIESDDKIGIATGRDNHNLMVVTIKQKMMQQWSEIVDINGLLCTPFSINTQGEHTYFFKYDEYVCSYSQKHPEFITISGLCSP